MQNQPAPEKYTGAAKVRVLPMGVSGEDLVVGRERKLTPSQRSRAKGRLRERLPAIERNARPKTCQRCGRTITSHARKFCSLKCYRGH